MTQKMTPASNRGTKFGGFLRAMGDLVILALLLVASGAGGYFWGIHQQLAPLEKVAPGTPGTSPMTPLPPPKTDAVKVQTGESSNPVKTRENSVAEEQSHEKQVLKKFWISSSGADYTGYSITVKVNDNAVDNFFGPGKNVDVTRLVKSGENSVVFDAKELGDQYNKHTGDSKSILTLQLVSGPHVSDSFKKSDVLLSYSRSAAQTDDASDTLKFTKE